MERNMVLVDHRLFWKYSPSEKRIPSCRTYMPEKIIVIFWARVFDKAEFGLSGQLLGDEEGH
jgi:hypothetical protein